MGDYAERPEGGRLSTPTDYIFHLSTTKEFTGGIPEVKDWLLTTLVNRGGKYRFRRHSPSLIRRKSWILFSVEGTIVGTAQVKEGLLPISEGVYHSMLRVDTSSIAILKQISIESVRELDVKIARIFTPIRHKKYLEIVQQSEQETQAHGANDGLEGRRYWVVSPNVRYDESTVSDWRQASVAWRAAFMGYHPNQRWHGGSGYKFAYEVAPGDTILIARRHEGNPETVGFGIVEGRYRTRMRGFRPPQTFGSLRRLSPFVPMSSAPAGLRVGRVLTHVAALRELYPISNSAHREICTWMLDRLNSAGTISSARSHRSGRTRKNQIGLAPFTGEEGLEYEVRTRGKVVSAIRREAALVSRYASWLGRQRRRLQVARYKSLRCDAYEKERNNLVEAKSSSNREYIRMAAGQLLDYSYQGRKVFGEPNMAILLPGRPDDLESLRWLAEKGIHIIWEERKAFLDDANGQFT